MAHKGGDPFQVWRDVLGEMEKSMNSIGSQAMETPEFSRVMNQIGGLSAGAGKAFGDAMERYLQSINVPSRAQVVSLAEQLRNIEGQLADIKSLLMRVHGDASGAPVSDVPRPPRTRQPKPAGDAS